MSNCFLLKLDSSGEQEGLIHFGLGNWSKLHNCKATTDTNANIYAVGPGGSLGLQLFKFDSTGAEEWRKEFGSDKHDEAYKVVADQNDFIYVVGQNWGTFSGGNEAENGPGGFLVKFDGTGNQIWVRQHSSSGGTVTPQTAAIDNENNIVIGGRVAGKLDVYGGKETGHYDFFLLKYNSDGDLLQKNKISKFE